MMTPSRRALLAAAFAPASPLAADPDRPQYHFLPPANWMNDPNAPIFHANQYHLYYQHNPKAAKWDTMHWGHAVSPDLLHWQHRPIALAPTPGGPDKDGCFTGCMVVDRGTPTIVYTGVNPQVQCVATSADLETWTKNPRNPVLAGPPPGVDSPGFRDPHVWRDGDSWLMLVGAGFRNKGGTALLYESKNLIDWTYLYPLLTGAIDPKAKGGDVARGEMWECPDFFPVGNQWLLHISTENKVRYWLGSWKNRQFTPRTQGTLVHGAGYAPKSSNASGNRRIIWAWLREQRSQEAQLKAGWSGVMSLAAVPSLAKDGTLLLDPAVEYQRLRGRRQTEAPPSDCCEIQLSLSGKEPFSLSRGGHELLGFDPDSRTLSAGRSEAPLPPGPVDLRIFLDGSVIEIFANRRTWLTGRVYGPAAGISMSGKASHLEAWPLEPVSKDRLTS
ncbi:MAG: glycoside hydrolase family 32 protein [Acidobacteria bacterium]|nr:glycoside hydrolase family 32 protein [Acidobacteriota bacterium]